MQVQGPASYPGGFTVSIPGNRTIIAASVVVGGTSAYGLPTVTSGVPLTAYVFTLIVLGA